MEKSSGTYWYGPGGSVLAETDSSGNWTNYIFFAGQRRTRNIPQPSPNPADIKYYVTDRLHSTAMFVDKSGSILDDNDFYPWGGVVPGVGSTTSTDHYKFTGKERDSESGLDDFGARYYSNAIGRFMSPDWAAKPTTVPYAVFGDPQSLNLYAYVRNSPIVRVDADGHTNAIYDTPLGTSRSGGEVWGNANKCQEESCTAYQQSTVGMTATTFTLADGTTQTIIHPTEGTVTAEDLNAGRSQARGKQPKAHEGNPDHLKTVGTRKNSFGGTIVTYQVVDKDGKKVTGVSVQEHVETLFAINTKADPSKDMMDAPTGLIDDVIGPKFGLPQHDREYLKTLQTFTAYKDGQAFPLSTKVNQYYSARAWEVEAVEAITIVP